METKARHIVVAPHDYEHVFSQSDVYLVDSKETLKWVLMLERGTYTYSVVAGAEMEPWFEEAIGALRFRQFEERVQ